MTKKEAISAYITKRIYALSEKETSYSKATLAELRRGVGKVPGEIPELWGAFLDELPAELCNEKAKFNEPTREEWAVYIALTLYALHCQGGTVANCKDVSLGKAAALLMNDHTDDERERVLRRFSPIVTSSDMNELSYHLRTLIQLMRSKDIALDYPKLACDIYDFQFESTKKNVQLNWGRDFYYINNKENEGE